MTSEGRKRKRSDSPDAIVSPGQLSAALSEHLKEPGRARKLQDTEVDQATTAQAYIEVDRAATAQASKDIEQPTAAQDFKDADQPATAQAYKNVDHPTARQVHQDLDLPTTPPDIPSVHTQARSTLPPTDKPTHPSTDEPHLQRRALSPTQSSHPHPESAEQPAHTDVHQPTTAPDYKDVDQPTTPPAVTSVRTQAIPAWILTDEPHLQRGELSSSQLSPTHVAYTDVDLPATPPVISPVHTPVRSTVPLTHANLRAINPDMSPKKSVDTSATGESSAYSGKNVSDLKNFLEIHGYYVDDENARAANGQFFEEVLAIVNGDRHSTMKPSSVQRINTSYKRSKNMNEDSFFHNYYPDLINRTRTIKTSTPEGVSSFEDKAWAEDGLLGATNQDFVTECVAAIPTNGILQEKLVKAYPKVATPKPDLLYGLAYEKSWCSDEQFDIIRLNSVFTTPSKLVVMPFMIVEAKGINGRLAEAELQALRGGAALNSTVRGLDAKTGSLPIKDGADNRSFVFSLVLDPDYARLNVHWAEIKRGKPVAYHMHRVKYYIVAQSEDWPRIRHDVDNVLDWGVVGRKTLVLDMLEKVAVREGAGLEQGSDSEEDVTEEASGKGKQKAKAKPKAKGKKAASSSTSASALGERRSSSRLLNKK